VTWLSLRQFRAQALVATGFLALLAIYVVVTGPHISHVFDAYVRNCRPVNSCNPVTSIRYGKLTKFLPEFDDLVTLTPALIGMFFGAPLVTREIESGSIRLVFTQSISRARWLGTKLVVVGVASAITAGLVSLMISWWARAWDHYNNLPFGTFDTRDVVPIAYSVFAFALGVLIGLLVRRTIPAMVTTLVLYGCANAAFGQWVRPHLYGFNVTSEYWTLQWIESLIYVMIALALGYASLWWMRRRYS
jgi:ABC-type transport system involved in multi-copper enzyme maturation permease subunit